jgi:carbamoyltransferase
MRGSLLGPEFTTADVADRLRRLGAVFEIVADEELFPMIAAAIADGDAVGWFQGRMEFGPRALGNRSILADARSPRTQTVLNEKIKLREAFRPFAPAVLSADVGDWFETDGASPYMLIVSQVRAARRRALSDADRARVGLDKLKVARSEIPAVTHVDGSARVQTVHRETNPRFHRLLEAFKAKTGCPVVVNTSFNVRGEPMVCTPEHAFRCFMSTDLDVLAIGNCVLRKAEQTVPRGAYAQQYEPG